MLEGTIKEVWVLKSSLFIDIVPRKCTGKSILLLTYSAVMPCQLTLYEPGSADYLHLLLLPPPPKKKSFSPSGITALNLFLALSAF